ncbi:MAG: ferredoxin [Candidatus Woesearchaeota archaeon]|nr:ferredoxin [Candidatus Woesearchaeota archaeon]
MIEIKQDRNICIGCGACVVVCPDNWVMDKDKKSKPKKTKLNEVGCNEEAASVCPVQCITIIKK